ncbi:hypothetical protein AA103196_2789 [Ameyamaea chiangmaiensis NBRC 103196]|uniref:Uncharacterized protein n=1 Tax=Ameyamaea chiangmaiensis TaxID=442969 RepID=A0A850PD37_9PROT|nr:hypothetical protein [Ameyamaea chiangmaiensis]MBS4074280.1 hypothetical protein [Ameyamaea chiangmaiensis]NVN40569.1 hypothetical protein [Ameyamaea chiangmaiensis]GBQ71486.1 hypothetical protein AA103196_2789 [Ameyamaea chiangmaiensis NBRC 103196]
MTTYAILTHDFRLLTVEQNRLVLRHPGTSLSVDTLVCVERAGDQHSFRTADTSRSWFDFDTEQFGRAIPTGFFDLVPVPLYTGYHIRRGAKVLRADPSYFASFVEQEPSLWETFRLIPVHIAGLLCRLIDMKWSVNQAETTLSFSARRSTFSHLALGEYRVDLDAILDKMSRTSTIPKSFIFFDGWKPNKAVLINPAIVFVLFGYGRVLREFQVSTESLASLAHYDGDVIVISDLPEGHLRSLADPKIADRLHVVPMDGHDSADFLGARLSLFATDHLRQYQPIVYTDADIVFDRPLAPILIKGAHARFCSAQVEEHTDFKNSDSVGAWLYRQDSFRSDDRHGFNSGILLVPNLDDHGASLAAAFRTLVNYAAEHGRRDHPYFDQSVLNYVLYKLGDFSPSPVTEHTQVGYSDFPEQKPAQKGFVHFWNTHHKARDMAQYITWLRENSQVRD